MKRNPLKNAIKVSNVLQMVTNKEKRNHFSMCLTPKGDYYWEREGIKLSTKQFNKIYPLDLLPIRNKGITPDSRRKGL